MWRPPNLRDVVTRYAFDLICLAAGVLFIAGMVWTYRGYVAADVRLGIPTSNP
jgi:hypothetical protein